jgi:DNA repair exonuclease SbcCD ATPase subunit
MIIERFNIKGFGCIVNRTFELKEGLNIFYGENESGKTTLQWFIKSMLFGLKGGRASKEGPSPPLKRFKPWMGEHFGGILEYRLDDGRKFRIERDFDKNRTKVYDSGFNDITDAFTAGKSGSVQVAESHLGLNESCFEKTVFIGQMESVLDAGESSELFNRLVNVSQTGFEDVSYKKAESALKNALKTYVGTGKTSTRPLDRVKERLSLLEAQKAELLERRRALFSNEQELIETELELERIEDGIRLLDEAGRAIEEKKSILRNKEILDKLMLYLEQVRGRGRSAKPVPGSIYVIGAGALAVLTFILGVFISEAFYAAASAAVIAALILALKRTKSRDANALSAGNEDVFSRASALCGMYINSAEQLEKQINKISLEVKEAEQKIGIFVNKYRTQFNRDDRDNGYYDEEIINLIINLGENLSDEDILKISAHREYDFKRLTDRRDKLRIRAAELKALLKSLPESSEIQEIEEEIQELKEKKEGLEDLNLALETAAEVLSEAAEEIQKDYAPRLGAKMSRIINAVSGGRYTELKADDSLRLKTVMPETGNIKDAADLSGGTIDQMYFALRVAAAEMIEENGETLPLILDEAFAQYDDTRLERVLSFLGDLALTRQVILFTCRKREMEAAAQMAGGPVNIIKIRNSG